MNMAHSMKILEDSIKSSKDIKIRADLFNAEMTINKALGLLSGKHYITKGTQ